MLTILLYSRVFWTQRVVLRSMGSFVDDILLAFCCWSKSGLDAAWDL